MPRRRHPGTDPEWNEEEGSLCLYCKSFLRAGTNTGILSFDFTQDRLASSSRSDGLPVFALLVLTGYLPYPKPKHGLNKNLQADANILARSQAVGIWRICTPEKSIGCTETFLLCHCLSIHLIGRSLWQLVCTVMGVPVFIGVSVPFARDRSPMSIPGRHLI
jgi:hypothetical protein